MISQFFTRQFLAFLAVGGLAASLHWLARVALSVWLPYWMAVGIAYGVGMGIAFALNRWFVFPNSDRPSHLQARDFVLVNLAFLPVVWGAALLIDAQLQSLGVARAHGIAHAMAIALPMFATFLFYKFVAFRQRSHG